jgi:sugar/nucleoside kinase (ribokinase family)
MTPRDIDCVVCGTCVADILVRPVPLAAPVGGGRLFHVDPIEVVTGGIVCNTGIAMRRLGMRVAAASLVGADAWGDLVRTRLAAEGIDPTALEADPAHHVGAPRTLGLDFVRRHAAVFARSRVALVGYFGLLPALEPDLAAALAVLKSAGCTVALETGGSGGSLAELAPALPHVDVYVPSLDEAAHQTGLADPRAIVDRYRGHGAAGIVGVKLGARGTLLSPAAGEFVEIPCVPAPGPVVDTTGAGDSLLAGLLTGIIRGMPLPDAGLLGAATAACCVTGLGAVAGLRSFEETWTLARGVLPS